MGKLPIQSIAIAGLVLLFIIGWFNTSSVNTTADAQPSEMSPNAAVAGELLAVNTESSVAGIATRPEASQILALRQALTEEQSDDLARRFSLANTQLSRGETNAAVSALRALIEDYPNFVEPYVNLASALAAQGELEEARLILADAAKANSSTNTLFASIDRLHGALAAQAYRQALENTPQRETRAELPIIEELSTDFALQQRVNLLSQRLASQQNQQDTFNADKTANAEQIATLQRELDQVQTRSDKLAEEAQQKSAKLLADLRKETSRADLAESELASLKKQSGVVENDLIAKLRIELANQQNSLSDLNAQLAQATSDNDKLKQALANQTAVAAVENPVSIEPTVAPIHLNVDREQAIGLVRDWAQAWSAQNVEKYLGYYRKGYRPNANLSHEQWVDQRRIRLTNKSFIDVKVFDFKVEPAANGFSVTFKQHYRSNTLDDTIVKQLVYVSSEKGDTRSAKIAAERIMR